MEAPSSKDFKPIWQAFMAAASELIISSVSALFTSLIPQSRIYATMSRKSGFGQSDEKYAMLSRIFQAELSEEANEAIPRNEILQTASAESSLSSIVSCFTLPWSAYVRLLSVRGSNWHLILLNAGETKG